MTSKQQIFALGGGGFSEDPENPILDKYLLSLVDKPRPKVCFVGTASGDADSYIEKFHTAFQAMDCETSHLSLFKPPSDSMSQMVLGQDIIYVGGGNTRNLLVLWREWNLDKMLRRAYDQGVILAGISAGSICWFEQGVTDSTGKLTHLECLGFLPGSNCPHYDGEAERRPAYQRLVGEGMKPGLACDDWVAAHFVGGKRERLVSSRPQSRAYEVTLVDGQVQEIELVPDYLGK